MELLNREVLVLVIYLLFLVCMCNMVITIALFYTVKKKQDRMHSVTESILESLWPSSEDRAEAGIKGVD